MFAQNQSLLSQRIGVLEESGNVDKNTLEGSETSFEMVSEAFDNQLQDFLKTLPKKKRKALRLHKHKHRSDFKELMKLNFLSSCAEPGEPVGVLAAQSIGEPSTQMT